MRRSLLLFYGVLSYAVFLVSIGWGVAFFGNLLLPRTIDGAASLPFGQALLANVALLAAFSLQHSGMARPRFKRWLVRYLPPVAERSTFVLLSSVTMIALMALWQPMGGVIWLVSNPLARQLILVAYFSGWILMIWATFLIDHFEMFGIRQAWCAFRGTALFREPRFQTPSAYKLVRHPIYTAWLIILWASPVMTVSHLVIASGLTLYVFLGASLEERDLEKRLPYYAQYRRKVPMLLPSWRKRLRPDGEI